MPSKQVQDANAAGFVGFPPDESSEDGQHGLDFSLSPAIDYEVDELTVIKRYHSAYGLMKSLHGDPPLSKEEYDGIVSRVQAARNAGGKHASQHSMSNQVAYTWGGNSGSTNGAGYNAVDWALTYALQFNVTAAFVARANSNILVSALMLSVTGSILLSGDVAAAADMDDALARVYIGLVTTSTASLTTCIVSGTFFIQSVTCAFTEADEIVAIKQTKQTHPNLQSFANLSFFAGVVSFFASIPCGVWMLFDDEGLRIASAVICTLLFIFLMWAIKRTAAYGLEGFGRRIDMFVVTYCNADGSLRSKYEALALQERL